LLLLEEELLWNAVRLLAVILRNGGYRWRFGAPQVRRMDSWGRGGRRRGIDGGYTLKRATVATHMPQGGTLIGRAGDGHDVEIIILTPDRLGTNAYVLGIKAIEAVIGHIPGIAIVRQVAVQSVARGAANARIGGLDREHRADGTARGARQGGRCKDVLQRALALTLTLVLIDEAALLLLLELQVLLLCCVAATACKGAAGKRISVEVVRLERLTLLAECRVLSVVGSWQISRRLLVVRWKAAQRVVT